jgi:glucosamine--fructose-6-phosphate aminotransferase (isomerizing)
MPQIRRRPPYLMTQMIAAEPAVAERIVRRLSAGDAARAVSVVAGMVHDAVRRGRPVITTGCGTSEHAAMAASWMLGDALEPGELWLVRSRQALDVVRQPVAEGALIAISHEGGTWATNEALRAVRPEHVSRALVSVSDRSPGAALADVVVETGEQDQSWCHTVGYCSPLVAVAAVAAVLRGGHLDAPSVRGLMEAASGQAGGAESVAGAMAGVDRIITVGTGRDEPATRELALKIEEGVGMPARALQLETLRHGHLAACDDRTGLVLILTDAEPAGEPVRERARAVLRSAAALGMPAAAILAPRVGPAIPAELTAAGRLDAPEANRLPPMIEAVLSTAIPLQLIAERLARARGRNPDPIGRDDPRQAAAGEA